MNNEIKHEIFMMYDLAGDKDLIYYEAIQRIIDYIADLEQENERLKELDENYPIEEELAEAYRREEDYKSRIEKANEFINENTELEHDGDDYGYTEWINIINMDTMTFINNLSDILNGKE